MIMILLDRSDFVDQNEEYELDPFGDPDERSPFDRMLKTLGLGLDGRGSINSVTITVKSFSTDMDQ